MLPTEASLILWSSFFVFSGILATLLAILFYLIRLTCFTHHIVKSGKSISKELSEARMTMHETWVKLDVRIEVITEVLLDIERNMLSYTEEEPNNFENIDLLIEDDPTLLDTYINILDQKI